MTPVSSLTTTLEIRILPLDQLRPAPYNPRQRLKSTDAAYRKLETSLREFGLVEPLIWNEDTGYIVGGHARLRILRRLGVKEAPVSVVHLTPEREKALNIVLNNREAQARFDTDLLTDLLHELEELPELELTGFDEDDLAALELEPIPDLETLGEETTEVEVTLEMDAETYEKLAARLDGLVGEFDLRCHVRRR